MTSAQLSDRTSVDISAILVTFVECNRRFVIAIWSRWAWTLRDSVTYIDHVPDTISVKAAFLTLGIDEPSQFFLAYTEQPTDTVSSQFTASDQATNRLVADIQSARDGWDVEQLPVLSLIPRPIRHWRRYSHSNTSGCNEARDERRRSPPSGRP